MDAPHLGTLDPLGATDSLPDWPPSCDRPHRCPLQNPQPKMNAQVPLKKGILGLRSAGGLQGGSVEVHEVKTFT